MFRRTLVTLICLTVMGPIFARAAEPMKDALAAIPGDAVGFVCVPNLKQLDGKWQQAVTNFGLQALVPPPWNSPVAAMQHFMQIPAGLETNGPVIFVQMPFENLMDMGGKNAAILPAADPKALVEAMSGEAGEGGVWKVKVAGQAGFAITGEKRVIVSDTATGVKAVAEAKGGMDAKWKDKDLKAFEGLDVVLWLDGERLLKTFKPQIDGLLSMFMMMQASAGPMGAKQAEAYKKQVDMLVEGTQAAMTGVSLDPAGVGLRFALNVKPGTELAKQLKVSPPSGSLLAGLPAGRYMLVYGQVFNPELAREAVKQLEPYFEAGKDVKSINAEQLTALKGVLEEWAPLTTAARVAVESLPPGPGGLIGASVVFETSDSTKWLELFGKAVEAARKLSSDKDAEKLAGAATYTPAGEEIAGLKVAQLKFDLSKIDQLDDDDREEVTAVLGKEGVAFRLAAVSPQRVVASFGGGADYMKRLIEQARKDDAPLDNTPGIQKVSSHLPKKPVAAGYLAADQIVGCIENVAKALEEDEALPFHLPEINAPAAMTSVVGKDSTQVDVFLPTELIVAVKDVALKMMMGSGAPGGPGKPAGVPEKKDETEKKRD